MAMGTERSKALHNFTLPCDLRWGNQRFLRCMKVNSNGPLSGGATGDSDSSDHHHQHHLPIEQCRTTRDGGGRRGKELCPEFMHGSSRVDHSLPLTPSLGGGRRFSEDDNGIAAMREKVMVDLQTAADKIKEAIFKDGLEEGEVSISPPLLPPPPPAQASGEGGAYRPWSLRTRRASSKALVTGLFSGRNLGASTGVSGGSEGSGGKALTVDVPRHNSGLSQIRSSTVAAGSKTPMQRNGVAAPSGEKMERPKISVALSKREIEEDFLAMVNHRPPRRPKKRAKNVQKQLDTLFPGLWLTEVTPDMYKVPEDAP